VNVDKPNQIKQFAVRKEGTQAAYRIYSLTSRPTYKLTDIPVQKM